MIPLTVLMSVYNGERFLPQAIQSILNQSFRDFEFIIINDGSTDNSLAIIQQYHDPRIRVVNHKKNCGLTDSLNEGIQLSRGTLIARMDADDTSKPTRFQQQIDVFTHYPGTGAVATGFERLNLSGQRIDTAIGNPLSLEEIFYTLFFYNIFAHSSVMMNREIIVRLGGYDGRYKTAQDADLWFKIAEQAPFRYIPQNLVSLRITDSGITANQNKAQVESAYQIFHSHLSSYHVDPATHRLLLHFHEQGMSSNTASLVYTNQHLAALHTLHTQLLSKIPAYLSEDTFSLFLSQKERSVTRRITKPSMLTLLKKALT